MSVEPGISNKFTFVGGLNTEGGVFTQPPNTWREGVNVVPQIDGSIHRRHALDLEPSYTSTNIPEKTFTAVEQEVMSTFVLRGSTNNPDLSYIVVQKGDFLSFYKAVENNGNISAGIIELDVLGSPEYEFQLASLAKTVPCQYSQLDGKLLVANRGSSSLIITIEEDGTLTSLAPDFFIRDFIGLDDGLDVNERPALLSNEHNYNLENQGWYDAQITSYFGATALNPSNAQSWIYGKDPTDVFSPALLDLQDFGNSYAPRGRKIINIMDQERTLEDGSVVSAATPTQFSFSTVAAFAGRAWWSGFNEFGYGSTVFFSQLTDDFTKWGHFYQVNDPTSEVFSDILDTDGGYVNVRDAGNIVKLVPIFNGMLVFAENGIWFIRGTANSAFSATNYEVVKVSDEGCTSPESIVVVENSVLYFGRAGIYVVVVDNVGNPVVQNMTDLTIKTFYTNIDPIFRNFAQGVYNPDTKIAQWLFSSVLSYQKDMVLLFDTRLKAWYTFQIGSGPFVQAMVVTEARMAWPTEVSGSRVTKYLAWKEDGNYKMLWCDMEARVNTTNPAKWKDFYSATDNVGTGNIAYVVTGHDFGNTHPTMRKHALYIVTYMKNTEDEDLGADANGDPQNASNCYMTSKWDFYTTGGKVEPAQQIYRFNQPAIAGPIPLHPIEVVVAKNKIRGRGRCVSLEFASDEETDMRLVGWAILWVGNTNA